MIYCTTAHSLINLFSFIDVYTKLSENIKYNGPGNRAV
jgi:hypothetical protein